MKTKEKDCHCVEFLCKGVNSHGDPCRLSRPDGKEFCKYHDPDVVKCASPTNRKEKRCGKLPLRGKLCCGSHKQNEDEVRRMLLSNIEGLVDDVKCRLRQARGVVDTDGPKDGPVSASPKDGSDPLTSPDKCATRRAPVHVTLSPDDIKRAKEGPFSGSPKDGSDPLASPDKGATCRSPVQVTLSPDDIKRATTRLLDAAEDLASVVRVLSGVKLEL